MGCESVLIACNWKIASDNSISWRKPTCGHHIWKKRGHFILQLQSVKIGCTMCVWFWTNVSNKPLDTIILTYNKPFSFFVVWLGSENLKRNSLLFNFTIHVFILLSKRSKRFLVAADRISWKIRKEDCSIERRAGKHAAGPNITHSTCMVRRRKPAPNSKDERYAQRTALVKGTTSRHPFANNALWLTTSIASSSSSSIVPLRG